MPNLSAFLMHRVPPSVRIKLHVALANASEALVYSYSEQAAQFVTTLAGRLAAEDALQRFFREVSVPAAMQETVRARAWILLAESLVSDGERHEEQSIERWTIRWADVTIDAVRRRVQLLEETNLACRLAGCMAEEAISVTHVRNALRVVDVLASVTSLEDALTRYVRAFGLSAVPAQLVFQRCLARVARQHPLLDVAAASDPMATATRPAAPSGTVLPSLLSVFG